MLKKIYKDAVSGALGVVFLIATGASQASMDPNGLASGGVNPEGAHIAAPDTEASFKHIAQDGGFLLLEQNPRLDQGSIRSIRIDVVQGESRTYRVTHVVTDSITGGFLRQTSIIQFSGGGKSPLLVKETEESGIATPNLIREVAPQ